MEVVEGLVGRCMPVITDSHGVEMPEIYLISKREVQFGKVARGHCLRELVEPVTGTVFACIQLQRF